MNEEMLEKIAEAAFQDELEKIAKTRYAKELAKVFKGEDLANAISKAKGNFKSGAGFNHLTRYGKSGFYKNMPTSRLNTIKKELATSPMRTRQKMKGELIDAFNPKTSYSSSRSLSDFTY